MRFRVPASTSNLGHGFDCLGLALGLVNEVAVATVAAPGRRGLDRLAEAVRQEAARVWSVELPALALTVTGAVPIARGLGSSATIIAAAAAACQRLAGRPAEVDELVPLAVAVEGHPDNVVACLLGGFTVAAGHGPSLAWSRHPVPARLRAVLVVPEAEVRTGEARDLLPERLERDQAVRGWQRTALITAAMTSDRPELLAGCFDQAWHEGYRARLNPGLAATREAAAAAGALGTFLSGSGSAICSLCLAERAESVRAALVDVWSEDAVGAAVHVLEASDQGLEATA